MKRENPERVSSFYMCVCVCLFRSKHHLNETRERVIRAEKLIRVDKCSDDLVRLLLFNDRTENNHVLQRGMSASILLNFFSFLEEKDHDHIRFISIGR